MEERNRCVDTEKGGQNECRNCRNAIMRAVEHEG